MNRRPHLHIVEIRITGITRMNSPAHRHEFAFARVASAAQTISPAHLCGSTQHHCFGPPERSSAQFAGRRGGAGRHLGAGARCGRKRAPEIDAPAGLTQLPQPSRRPQFQAQPTQLSQPSRLRPKPHDPRASPAPGAREPASRAPPRPPPTWWTSSASPPQSATRPPSSPATTATCPHRRRHRRENQVLHNLTRAITRQRWPHLSSRL